MAKTPGKPAPGHSPGSAGLKESVQDLQERIQVAKGVVPAELVLKGGKVVNVWSGEIQETDLVLHKGRIAALGPGYRGKVERSAEGKWVAPGFIDAHLHVESTMLAPSQLAGPILIHGTTAVVADPHEIANVKGMAGVQYMLEESEGAPVDFFFMAPSCVPATQLETAGAELGLPDLMELKDRPRVLGLAEMMNFHGVLKGEQSVLEKIALFHGGVIDGHCPLLRGRDLQAYAATGIGSDHECTSAEEAREKVGMGMVVMIRQGSTAKNLEALLPAVTAANARRFCLVSDDLHVDDIQQYGHLDEILRAAVRLGLGPVTAIQMVTRNPAEYFGLQDRGSVTPGMRADLVLLEDLKTMVVSEVYKDGTRVVENGTLRNPLPPPSSVPLQWRQMNMAPVTPDTFRIPHPGGRARIMELIPGQITTRMSWEEVPARDGVVAADADSDIVTLYVLDRHQASGRVGRGLVRGLGLRQGAIASTIAHDSHNVIAAGVSAEDTCRAVETLGKMGGGLSVAAGGRIRAKLPLEVAGLMSTRTADAVAKDFQHITRAVHDLGCRVPAPFMTLSFLALPVIPELKLTDRGLVDVHRFEIVPLFQEP